MLGTILGAITGLGSILGGAGRGAAAERQSQNDFLQRENQMRLQQYAAQQQALAQLLGLDESATMNRAQLGIQAPSARAKQAVVGSLLARLQPARVTPPSGVRMGQLSGGLGGAIGNGGMQQAGNALLAQALQALIAKSDVPGQTNYAQRGLLQTPAMAAYKGAGKGESLLSALGLAGGVAGAVQPLLRKPGPASGTPTINLGANQF